DQEQRADEAAQHRRRADGADAIEGGPALDRPVRLDREQREQQRRSGHRQVGEEDRAPAGDGDEHAPQRRADRGREAEPGAEPAERPAALSRRYRRAQERRAVRHHRAARDRLPDAEGDDERKLLRQGRGRRARGEAEQAAQERPPVTEQVAEAAAQGLDDRHGDEVRADEPRGAADGDVERVRDRRQREGDHRRVERDQRSREDDARERRAPLRVGGQRPSSTTSPLEPSTVIVCPSAITRVATFVPITAGMRYSRATIAPCESTPPVSATSALIEPKTGVHGGVVLRQTRMSPERTRCRSSMRVITRATPVTRPADAGAPRSTPSASSGGPPLPKNFSSPGSAAPRGGAPRKG